MTSLVLNTRPLNFKYEFYMYTDLQIKLALKSSLSSPRPGGSVAVSGKKKEKKKENQLDRKPTLF